MVKKNVSLNIGYCQGVMNAGVFSPSPSYARMDVRTKNGRKNPVTKRYDMQVFNFVALGDMVEQIVHGCKVGDRVTVSYYLKERVHINKRTGKGAFVNEMIIKDIFVRSAAEKGKVGSFVVVVVTSCRRWRPWRLRISAGKIHWHCKGSACGRDL